jgi:hypothetical protein
MCRSVHLIEGATKQGAASGQRMVLHKNPARQTLDGAGMCGGGGLLARRAD